MIAWVILFAVILAEYLITGTFQSSTGLILCDPITAMIVGGTLGGGGAALSAFDTPEREWIMPPIEEAGAFEKQMRELMQSSAGDFSQMVGAGPGMSDITASLGAQRDLASTLQGLSQTGFVPTESDISGGMDLAGRLQAAEREQQRQLFKRQEMEADRLGARMGRGVSDPILKAKLMQSQADQASLLGARRTAMGTQIAMGRPEERLRLEGARANVLGGLASQALQNRMTLLNMGNQLSNAERNFRLQKASMQQMKESPGTLGKIGSIASGLIGGAGAGLGIAGGISSIGLTNAMAANLQGGGGGMSQAMAPMMQIPNLQPSGMFSGQSQPGSGMNLSIASGPYAPQAGPMNGTYLTRY